MHRKFGLSVILELLKKIITLSKGHSKKYLLILHARWGEIQRG